MLLTCLMCFCGFILNEDDSHFFMSREPDQMTVEGLNAFVDQYAGTQVTHLFLCPNAMKASYRSNVWDAIWDLTPTQVEPKDDPVATRWMSNAKLLHERGLDPYEIWIARCREKGIRPWLSMRMNDVHNADNVASYIHSTFWIDHPEYWRVPGGGGWTDRAFDYAIPEVREHHMKFIRELLERYDPNGLELDWMRFGYHFKPGHEAEGRPILTRFMREVRALTREWSSKRGHRIMLGARVPATPKSAFGLGMDAVAWAREGLIDLVVPTPFWATADFDIPVEQWRKELAATSVAIAPGAEILLRAYPGAEATTNDIMSIRGFAASCLDRGADRIYTFNYMDPAPMTGGPEAYRALLEQGLSLVPVTTQPRRHPVTYRDTVAPGASNGAQLPAQTGSAQTMKSAEFKIHIGPAPENGTVTFVAGLAQKDAVAGAEFEATINGEACEPLPDLDNPSQFPGSARAIEFKCPIKAIKDGYNIAEIKQVNSGADQQIIWAELRITP